MYQSLEQAIVIAAAMMMARAAFKVSPSYENNPPYQVAYALAKELEALFQDVVVLANSQRILEHEVILLSKHFLSFSQSDLI